MTIATVSDRTSDSAVNSTNKHGLIRIIYVAKFREDVGYAEENVELPADMLRRDKMTVAQVLALLALKGGCFKVIAESKSAFFAIGEDIVQRDALITAGDSLVIFPNVTGG